jgi:hypothetical protein
VVGSLVFLCKVVRTTALMTFKSIAFPFTFGSILLTIAIAFVFHEFTKILLMVVRPINFPLPFTLK